MQLRYGLNPNQKPAEAVMESGDLPFTVLNGQAGYINLLDALNGWQLVRELKQATGLPSAASFKHVSPAGVGTAVAIPENTLAAYQMKEAPRSGIATAYVRARGADRLCSYGDFISLSDPCDAETANLIAREVSDGIIAPGYSDDALTILKSKKKGNYLVLQIDPSYEAPSIEKRQLFGVTLVQPRNDVVIDASLFQNIPTISKSLPESAQRDLIVALVTLKYTQSNSVCFTQDGQTLGVGAGQQSRVHCVRLAAQKADLWHLRQHPKVLSLPFKDDVKIVNRDNAIDSYLGEEADSLLADGNWQELFTARPEPLSSAERKSYLANIKGVSMGSDAFFPFGDSIERAARSGVSYVAQAGGSIRDDQVIETCDRFGITMAMTGVRLFHH